MHVTQAKSPAASARTSESVKFISAVFSKIASQEERTDSQPVRSGQPGWTHLTWSACAHTASIRARSSVSKAR